MPTETRVPNSDEHLYGKWTANSLYKAVDCYPDITHGLTLSGSAGNITFGFDAISLPLDATDIHVSIDYWDRDVSAGNNGLTGRLKVGGQYFDNSVIHNPTNTATQYTSTWNVNPKTGLAWTIGQINGTEPDFLQAFGVKSGDSRPSICLMCLQLRIDYSLPEIFPP